MKKTFIALLLSPVLFYSCSSNGSDKPTAEQLSMQNDELTARLQETLATQDSLFLIINEMTGNIEQIKHVEEIVSLPGGIQEMPSKKEQVINDMIAIQNTLNQRRMKIAELESKLKKLGGENATLLTTINNLKKQIEEQQNRISQLDARLEEANIHIAYLDSQIDSLNSELTDVTAQKNTVVKEAEQLTDELNTCYYAVGTKKELSESNIMKSGFLRKTKILPADFDHNYFTRADKRTLVEIPLHSKKAEILTNQPQDSYQLVDVNGWKVLKITNPAKFWELTNFLVIRVD